MIYEANRRDYTQLEDNMLGYFTNEFSKKFNGELSKNEIAGLRDWISTNLNTPEGKIAIKAIIDGAVTDELKSKIKEINDTKDETKLNAIFSSLYPYLNEHATDYLDKIKVRDNRQTGELTKALAILIAISVMFTTICLACGLSVSHMPNEFWDELDRTVGMVLPDGLDIEVFGEKIHIKSEEERDAAEYRKHLRDVVNNSENHIKSNTELLESENKNLIRWTFIYENKDISIEISSQDNADSIANKLNDELRKLDFGDNVRVVFDGEDRETLHILVLVDGKPVKLLGTVQSLADLIDSFKKGHLGYFRVKPSDEQLMNSQFLRVFESTHKSEGSSSSTYSQTYILISPLDQK